MCRVFKWALSALAFLGASQVLPVNAQTPVPPTIGPGTPCVAEFSEVAYTGSLLLYEIYIDVAAPVPGTTAPTFVINGPNLPSAPPYDVVWSICGNLPNLTNGNHTIAVASKNAAGYSGVSVVSPFVFASTKPPAPTFSSPPVR